MNHQIPYVNYHKHTDYSNIMTLDCVVKPEDYMKRAIELGHKEYVTTEHGYQGNIFEAYTLCQKYGLKCIYGVEAYYVDDMYDKTERNYYHLILIAMNDNGIKQINSILSKANVDGFYYKPRIDLQCLLSLNPDDVIITTACVAGRLFKGENWEEKFFIPVFNHFKNHLFLEVQCHNSPIQKRYNQHILNLKKKYNVSLIHANDSHYIFPNDSKYRNLFLKAKEIGYPDESDFILDYPDTETIAKRYLEQGVLNKQEIAEAIKNTNIISQSEGIHIDKEFKIPKISKEMIQNYFHTTKYNNRSNDEILLEIIKRAWSIEKGFVKAKRIPQYKKAITEEFEIIKKCGTSAYFILDHMIVKKAVNDYNAVMTKSGRGSSVSFYINKLLGLTEVDRIKAPTKLYPTRFMSAERILQAHSLPDIDLNTACDEPLVKASKDILGEDGIYFMVSYKPLQESSAFRLWCKAKNYIYAEYNEVAKNLDNYKTHPKWGKIIEDSLPFKGVIESISPSPCSYLLLDKPISKEVGLLRVGKEICCCLDGYNCDVYKYLKNDYLTVKVWSIISETYKLINQPIDSISSLIHKCDDKVWDVYAKGLTTTINQADSDYAKLLVRKYKPKNLAELSAFVAAIRPAFASLLDNFLNRKPYSTGIKELDDKLQDSFHYLLYQESIMSFLIWLGMEEKKTYDIIKKISKKKFTQEELAELKSELIKGWVKNVGSEKGFKETWQVVEDASHYAFNASHSLSVAIDSLYGAYLKSHYPLEYFTVVLSQYSDDMDRTANLNNELSYFNIKLNPIEFGKSSADYSMDKKNNSIYKGIASIKYCNSIIAQELLAIANYRYKNFFELLKAIADKTSVNSRQLKALIKLNFFKKYGKNKTLLQLSDIYNGVKKKSKTILPSFKDCKQISKNKITSYEQYGIDEFTIHKYSNQETEKMYKDIDNTGLLNEIATHIPNKSLSVIEQVEVEKTYLGYVTYKNPKIKNTYYIIVEYEDKNETSRPKIILRNLNNGEEINTIIKSAILYKSKPFGEFSILDNLQFSFDLKQKYIDGKWQSSDETEQILTNYEVIKNANRNKEK